MANLSNINNKFLVTTGGNVGIGVTGPLYRLEASGSDFNFVGKFQATGSGYAPASILLETTGSASRGQGMYHYNTTANENWFTGVPYDVNSEKWIVANKPSATQDVDTAQLTYALMTIASTTGNVGIGTDSPGYKLDVRSSLATIAMFDGTYAGIQGIQVQRNGGDNVRLTANYSGYGGGLESSDALRFSVNGADISNPSMYIETTGNVGIGTALPSRPLHVNSGALNFVAEFQSTDDKASILIQDDDTLNYIHSQDGYLSLGGQSALSSGNLNIRTSDGNVGIGTDSPGAKLDVTTLRENGIRLSSSDITAFPDELLSGIEFYSPDTSGGAGVKASIQVKYNDGDANSYMTFGTGTNVERMRITSSGQVNIATPITNAFYGLSLQYNAIDTAEFKVNQATGQIKIGGVATGYFPTFYSAGTERMRIDSSGNVGINNTNPSSYGKFLVEGTGNLINANASSGAATFQLYEGGQGRFAITTLNGSAGAKFLLGGTERMRIDSDGNVGIGTSSPIFDLQTNLTITGSPLVYLNNTSHVLGTQNFAAVHNSSAVGTNSSSGLLLANNDSSNGAASPPIFFSAKSVSNTYNAAYASIYGVKTSSGADTNWCAGDIVFATSTSSGANERMRISSVGRVTINQTAVTDAMLTVGGNSSNYALTLYMDVLYASNYRYQRFRSGSNIAGGIEGSNQTSVVYNTSSDYRMKKNIKPLENGLERLSKLKPVKFDWKLNDESTEGFIAHEVQEIFPDAISGEKDGEDMQGMDYGRITPLLVAAIQELKAEIELLKSK